MRGAAGAAPAASGGFGFGAKPAASGFGAGANSGGGFGGGGGGFGGGGGGFGASKPAATSTFGSSSGGFGASSGGFGSSAAAQPAAHLKFKATTHSAGPGKKEKFQSMSAMKACASPRTAQPSWALPHAARHRSPANLPAIPTRVDHTPP